jgi:repressor LexA
MYLTKRQKQILDFLKEHIELYGFAPSIDEIRKHFSLGSLATVHKHLMTLERKRVIRREPNQSRSIELMPTTDFNRGGLVDAPLMGTIAAGEPIEAIEERERIALPEELVGTGPCYVLKVRGSSMIDEHIRDGDFVIIEERQTADNGQTVVALLDGTDVTLKKYYDEGARIRLQPANPELEPIYVDKQDDRLQIQGIVIGLLRKY